MITNNRTTEPILGCLDIASAKELNPIFFNFDNLLGHERKAATFFAKNITKKFSSLVADIIPL